MKHRKDLNEDDFSLPLKQVSQLHTHLWVPVDKQEK